VIAPSDWLFRESQASVALGRASITLWAVAVAVPVAVACADDVWVASWGSVPAGCVNLEPMVWLPGDYRPGVPGDAVDGEELAKQLKSRKPGRRALLANRYCHSFWGYRPDLVQGADKGHFPGPWADSVLPEINKDWPQILRIVQACGGSVDYLICDFEEWGRFTTWNMSESQIDAVRGDPRWKSSRLGTPSMAELAAGLDGLSAAQIKDPRGDAYLVWNYAAGRVTAAYMNTAIWDPAIHAFPRIVGSNYRGWSTPKDPPPCGNGHLQPDDNVFGNAISPSLYGEVESLTSRFIDPANPTTVVRQPREGAIPYSRGPWQSFLLAHQQARAAVRGGSGRIFLPWVAHASYDGTPIGRRFVGFPEDLRCYDEHIRHLVVLGAPALLWWRNPTDHPEADAVRLDQLITDSNQACLGRVASPVTAEPISFLSDIVISGARRRDGRYVWRVSMSPRVSGLIDAATGADIAVPKGSLGVWIVTDSSSVPQISVRLGPEAETGRGR
jgi:hypothetical protein